MRGMTGHQTQVRHIAKQFMKSMLKKVAELVCQLLVVSASHMYICHVAVLSINRLKNRRAPHSKC